MEQKRGNLHYVTVGFMIVIFLIMLLCTGSIWEVEKRIREKNALEVSEDICREQSDALKDASDYLTEQFRRFILTEDENYLNLYWKEVEEDRRRDHAIEKLGMESLTAEEFKLISLSKAESDYLITRELQTMRLVVEGNGLKEEDMPPALRDVLLSEPDRMLSSEEKKTKAREMVVGQESEDAKKIINENLRGFQKQLKQRKNAEVQVATKTVKATLDRVRLYNVLLVILVLIQIVIFYFYVVFPFLRYSKQLQQMDPETGETLQPSGCRDMKTFAVMFNNLYSDLRKEKKKLERLNLIDTLTGIANRAALDDYVHKKIEEGEMNIGLLMMDVDDFKTFNDGFGHLIGDQVLIKMGRCFETIADREGGLAGRLGGEEFIVVVPDVIESQIEQIAADIMDAAVNIDTRKLGIPVGGIHITVSIGSTLWEKGRPGDMKSLIHQADMALYEAKARGKNQHVVFSKEEELFARMEHEKLHRQEVEADMYHALEHDEFLPFFQPKYDLETRRICGAEALVRWDHQIKGCLYPCDFVPVLEKDGFITKIDFIMFDKICACIQAWEKAGLPLVTIACNFSRLNFGKETLVPELLRITEKYGVPHSLIQVELTENGLMEQEAVQKMKEEFLELHEAGFSIAIDDFGTGYSSLAILHELPVDVLKVDQSFVRRDLKLRANELLLNGILYIATVMNMDTVVEGVETKEQAELLKKIGYRVVQGFYFSKPVPQEVFEQMLRE